MRPIAEFLGDEVCLWRSSVRFRSGLRSRRRGFLDRRGGEDAHRMEGLGGGRRRRRRRAERLFGNVHAAGAEKGEGKVFGIAAECLNGNIAESNQRQVIDISDC